MIVLRSDALGFSQADRCMLACFHLWLLGSLVDPCLPHFPRSENWSFGCPSTSISTFLQHSANPTNASSNVTCCLTMAASPLSLPSAFTRASDPLCQMPFSPLSSNLAWSPSVLCRQDLVDWIKKCANCIITATSNHRPSEVLVS
jgi:hypothetical protein